MSAVRVRFAPSPTGILHLGGLRTALFNFLFARQHGGQFVLRIEDTDKKRFQPGALRSILDSLDWAGIPPDEGPTHGGRHGPYVQSERQDVYGRLVDRLLAEGAAYRCFCSAGRLEMLARDQRRRGETPGYDKKCRHLSAAQTEAKLRGQEPHVVRFKLEEGEDAFEDIIVGHIRCDIGRTESDPVILKSDGMPVYHLANVVDDHLMEISHVIRGIEWLPSLPKHRAIYRAFGWTPPAFAHVPLLLNRERMKLSKRSPDHDKFEIARYQGDGYRPETILNWLLRSGGGFAPDRPWRPGMSLMEMVAAFRLDKLSATGAELNWPSLEECGRTHFSQLMHSQSGRQNILEALSRRYATPLPRYEEAEQRAIFERILAGRAACLADLDEFAFVWAPPDPGAVVKAVLTQCSARDARSLLHHAAGRLGGAAGRGDEEVTAVLRAAGVGKRQGMRVLRLSLVGLTDGPRVSELLAVLPARETKKRLEAICSALEKVEAEAGPVGSDSRSA